MRVTCPSGRGLAVVMLTTVQCPQHKHGSAAARCVAAGCVRGGADREWRCARREVGAPGEVPPAVCSWRRVAKCCSTAGEPDTALSHRAGSLLGGKVPLGSARRAHLTAIGDGREGGGLRARAGAQRLRVPAHEPLARARRRTRAPRGWQPGRGHSAPQTRTPPPRGGTPCAARRGADPFARRGCGRMNSRPQARRVVRRLRAKRLPKYEHDLSLSVQRAASTRLRQRHQQHTCDLAAWRSSRPLAAATSPHAAGVPPEPETGLR